MSFEYKPQRDSYDAPVDPNRCRAAVSFGGRAVGFRQCLRKPWKDGWCKQHHPDTVAERRKRQDRMAQQRLENSPIMRLVKARREIEGLQARIDKALAWIATQDIGSLDMVQKILEGKDEEEK